MPAYVARLGDEKKKNRGGLHVRLTVLAGVRNMTVHTTSHLFEAAVGALAKHGLEGLPHQCDIEAWELGKACMCG